MLLRATLFALALLAFFIQSAQCEPERFEPDTIIAAVSPGVTDEALAKSLQAANVRLARKINNWQHRQANTPLFVRITVPPSALDASIRKLQADPIFTSVGRNYYHHLAAGGYSEPSVAVNNSFFSNSSNLKKVYAAPNDPLFPNQWHLAVMHWLKAYNSHGMVGEPVAVVDTGCGDKDTVKELNLMVGYDTFQHQSLFAWDTHGHGTKIATVVAGKCHNGVGGVGVSPHAYIYPIKAVDNNGWATDERIIEALSVCTDKGLRIIHISVTFNDHNMFLAQQQWQQIDGKWVQVLKYHPVVEATHLYANNVHGFIFIPAGNDGAIVPALGSMRRVAGLDNNLHKWFSSNIESTTDLPPVAAPVAQTNEACAPAVGIISYGSYAENNGTCFSAAMLAGAASLGWGKYPKLSQSDLYQVMMNSTQANYGTAEKFLWMPDLAWMLDSIAKKIPHKTEPPH